MIQWRHNVAEVINVKYVSALRNCRKDARDHPKQYIIIHLYIIIRVPAGIPYTTTVSIATPDLGLRQNVSPTNMDAAVEHARCSVVGTADAEIKIPLC